MNVYHGSYTEISKVDLLKCEPNKDFGRGFYVTKFRKQAEVWAEKMGNKHETEGVVTEFIFFENAFTNGVYKVLRFEDYTEEWLDFVVLNRRKDSPALAHDFDIIEGPVADDRISENITRYLNGKISREKFFAMLRREEEPTHQICFCTADSLLMLEKKDKSSDIAYELSEIGDPLLEQLMIDYDFDEEKVQDLFYNSKTFSKLSDKSTELYLKNWAEIYDLLKKELDLE